MVSSSRCHRTHRVASNTMKARYIKRILKKFIVLVVALFVLSILAIKILERRHTKSEVISESVYEKRFSSKKIDKSGVAPIPPVVHSSDERSSRRRRPAVINQHLYVKPVLEDELNLEQFYDINVPFRLPESKGPKRDWNDYIGMELEMKRVGLGEQGVPAYITDETKKELERQLSMDNGFNALLSDSISVNRSVPDVRKEECRHRQYLAHLPTTSVVIPFYNEHFSVLIRTIYSIKNRTPPELLHEIIIVDDFSDREYLKQQLDDFVANSFKGLVTIIRLQDRTGLIGARLAGARRATGDVIVFFDSHVECNHNWLPPLLEPIALNKRISTCPIIDGIDHATFEHNSGHQEGSRGAFDWKFIYKQLPVLPADSEDKTSPFRNPIMMGGLFAIGREFFWELGGYDDGLDIWGAEQYELSFKIWMCGGLLLDVPCSRVAHVFRGPMNTRPSPRNYLAKNHKRVAEVWMDEYKQYIYDSYPEAGEVDAGDVTKQIERRKNLKCKSFKWFMDKIAPDLEKAYPPVLPPHYASGAIQSLAFPQYCVDTMHKEVYESIGLFSCALNMTHPQANQFWSLSHFRDIRKYKEDICLDVHDSNTNSPIWMWACHNTGSNQFWSYDVENQMIVHGVEGYSCMEAFEENGKLTVYANPCDKLNPRMRWKFGWLNETALNQFWNNVEY